MGSPLATRNNSCSHVATEFYWDEAPRWPPCPASKNVCWRLTVEGLKSGSLGRRIATGEISAASPGTPSPAHSVAHPVESSSHPGLCLYESSQANGGPGTIRGAFHVSVGNG